MTPSTFLQTPDTVGYMLAGYIVFVTLPVLFILSLLYRYRNLRQDEAAVKEALDDENNDAR